VVLQELGIWNRTGAGAVAIAQLAGNIDERSGAGLWGHKEGVDWTQLFATYL
jgi:hypothetical protein